MSQPHKDTKKQFLLPSALRQLQQHSRVQTQQRIKELDPSPPAPGPTIVRTSTSLFKLNPHSSALISEVPLDTLRKRSKSQKLENKQQEQQEVFSLLENYRESQIKKTQGKPSTLKKYDNIDLRQFAPPEAGRLPEVMDIEEQQRFQIVKPSQTYQPAQKRDGSFFEPTLFQTPPLPCFPSSFQQASPSKPVKEAEGLWRIGKVRVKEGKCQMRMGQFVFEGRQAPSEGQAGLMSVDRKEDGQKGSLSMIPKWRGLWILQPHQSIFQ